jgi:hypothetical protein
VYIRLLSLFGLAEVKYAHGVLGTDRNRGDDPTARLARPDGAKVPAMAGPYQGRQAARRSTRNALLARSPRRPSASLAP